MKFDFLVEQILNSDYDYVIISGLHGDEPAGDLAAQFFKNKPNIKVFSNINKTNKRRIGSEDPNRHFDTDDKNDLQDRLLAEIEKINPKLVISLHEDDEADGVYAYCSSDIEDKVKNSLAKSKIKLTTKAHNDITDDGVITNGQQPYKGSLEIALKKRNIPYCTLETPSSTEDIQTRVDTLIAIINSLI